MAIGKISTLFIVFSLITACGGGQAKTFDYSTLPDSVDNWDNIKRCTAPENAASTSCNTYRHAVTY